MDSIKNWIMGYNDFPARWFCGNWSSVHGWVHIISDFLVWGAYMTIPIILIYFVRRKKNIPFSNVFWLFGAFIFACGTTHLIESFIFWAPIYRISAAAKILTAVISWITVFFLIPIVPKALSYSSPEVMQMEVERRESVEIALKEKEEQLAGVEDLIKERKQTLDEKAEELKKLNELMIDREVKMATMKKQIQDLYRDLEKRDES